MDLPLMEDAAEFLAKDIPAPAVLAEGLIHSGTKMALGGASKAMKTWTQLLLALSVSHGLKFFGRRTTKSKVLFVNLEIPQHFCQRRVEAIAKALHIKVEKGQFLIWNLRGKAASHKILIPEIRKRIGNDFGLIIIDPIYKAYGENLDENSAGDVADLLNSIEDLAVTSGAAVSISAHYSKGNQSGKESIDRISGSGVFARDPDTLLTFTKHEEDDCFTVEPTLRNFPPAEPFVVRWHHPLMIVDDFLDPSKLKRKGKGPERKFPLESIVKLLEGGVPLTVSEMADELKCNRRTLYSGVVPQMKDDPRFERYGENRWKLKHIPF